MKYRLSPSCGPRRGLGYMKICDYLSKSWAMETLKVKKYFFTRERALCTICVYLPLVYSVRKKKKKKLYGRYSAYDRRSRCIQSEHQRITSLPPGQAKTPTAEQKPPHTPIASWFLPKCWPGDWVVFYLAASIGSLQGFPVNRVWIKSTFRLPSGSIA